MKKIIVIVIIGLLIAANSWAVIVTGSGVTKEEAINNGLREAVEMYTGALVYGVTDVENYQIKKDQLVAASLGYVKNYRIIKSSKIDDLILITMDVKLSEDKIETIVRENINLITIDDVLKDYNNVTQRQDQIKKLIKMLHTMARRPVREKYGVIYEGYTIKRISATTVDTILNVRITQNPFYHKAYNEILKNLSEPTNSPEVSLVGGDYSISGGRLINKNYHISRDSVNTRDLYNVEAQVYVNDKPVDQCREYQDNLMVVFSTTKFVTGVIRLFPSEFKKAWKGDETPIDDKWDHHAIKGSKIIPPEGLPLKIKYQIKNSKDIKNLKDLKLVMTRCGGELKPVSEKVQAENDARFKERMEIKARKRQYNEERAKNKQQGEEKESVKDNNQKTFVKNEDGTITDTSTGLMWAAVYTKKVNWEVANGFCKDYRGGGHSDWRMPAQGELAEVYGRIDLVGMNPVWASETRDSEAAYFTFYGGDAKWTQSRVAHCVALPVRSTK